LLLGASAIIAQPASSLEYIDGKHVGTAEQFTRPFRPLRVAIGPERGEFRAPGYRIVSSGSTRTAAG
jgi:hypothetical protein